MGNQAMTSVLVRCCIWAMDCQQPERCMQLAEYAIQHHMPAPEEFTRTVPEILMEELALSEALHAEQPQDYCESLLRLDELTHPRRCAGRNTRQVLQGAWQHNNLSNTGAALSFFQQAARYGASVKTNLNK